MLNRRSTSAESVRIGRESKHQAPRGTPSFRRLLRSVSCCKCVSFVKGSLQGFEQHAVVYWRGYGTCGPAVMQERVQKSCPSSDSPSACPRSVSTSKSLFAYFWSQISLSFLRLAASLYRRSRSSACLLLPMSPISEPSDQTNGFCQSCSAFVAKARKLRITTQLA